MARPRLKQLFATLEAPREQGTLRAARLDERSRYRVARDFSGDAALLLELRPRGERAAEARAIRLKHFEYEPRVAATIREATSDAAHEGEFLVLRCREADSELEAHFFELLDDLVDLLGAEPSEADADGAIHGLVELFRSMSAPSRRTIVGLWAELLVIADAPDPTVAAAAWHSAPGEQHDFVSGLDRIEVKSTTRSVREHEVALDQLVVPEGGVGFLVSFMLSPSDVGVSANDLLRMANERLPTHSEARRRLRAIFAETIGDGWRDAELTRFDLPRARESRRIYDARGVPSIDRRIPPQVSRVQFTVDLSDLEALAPEDAGARIAFAGATLGKAVVE